MTCHRKTPSKYDWVRVGVMQLVGKRKERYDLFVEESLAEDKETTYQH